ncbi:MAG: dienelactone hydrolase family protein [Acidimicrobiales bacterium]
MTVTTRNERVTAGDGEHFDARCFLPEEPGPGVVLFQEIWGVGEFIEAKARLLAELGYVVLCPDVFWRVERHVVLAHDDAGLGAAFEYAGRFAQIPADVTSRDLVSSLDHLRSLGEVTGGLAAMGYCLGGRLAFELAAAGDPDACVSYYGSGIASELHLADRISCPALFHFGGADPYIPHDDVEHIEEVFSKRAGSAVVVQADAGHAFENSFAPAFSNPDATSVSWPRTLAFLESTLSRSG